MEKTFVYIAAGIAVATFGSLMICLLLVFLAKLFPNSKVLNDFSENFYQVYKVCASLYYIYIGLAIIIGIALYFFFRV